MAPSQPRAHRSTDRHPEPQVEEWEDWDDDDPVTPIQDDDEAPMHVADSPTIPRQPSRKRPSSRVPISRSSVKIQRLKSRHRQKAQNKKAGISLVTDMTVFRKPAQMQMPDSRQGKFVDAAALKALEGEPNSASMGNWNWLKRSKTTKSPHSATPVSARSGLSPSDRPIVIGIAMPEDDLANRQISPQTAVVETPIDFGRYVQQMWKHAPANGAVPPQVSQPTSVWSPDTPDTASSFRMSNRASSMYSQNTGLGGSLATNVPPMPQVPANYKQGQKVVNIQLSKEMDDDDDGGSPCTLFEEDGTAQSQRKSLQVKLASARSPASAGAQSQLGWWDTVTTPFSASPMTARPTSVKSSKSAKKESISGLYWGGDEKKDPLPSPIQSSVCTHLVTLPEPVQVVPRNAQITPIVRAPTPKRTPSPGIQQSASPASSSSLAVRHHQLDIEPMEKPVVITGQLTSPGLPPPYSPPRNNNSNNNNKNNNNNNVPIRYRAVFPPGHPLHSQYPPSPGPVSPGIAGTMTSQGGINMTDIPLTPAARSSPAPPSRLASQYAPEFPPPPVSAQGARVERRRQRHEKEDQIARRAGGLWRGRGCIPSSGCYGRSGREGRKKRRVKLGIILAIALLALTIGLAVGLTRGHASTATVDSIFLNLTSFPPMPTGVVTVVGPDNSKAVSGCTSPSTLWSCALPKEQQGSNLPFNGDQPTFIMQIQFDNDTQQLWSVPNGTPPQTSDPAQPATTTFDSAQPTTAAAPQSTPSGSGIAAAVDPRSTPSGTEPSVTIVGRTSMRGSIFSRAIAVLRGRASSSSSPALFTPFPAPPSFQEMFFLGNTTDGILSDNKAGEPTPFYISLLRTVNATAGPNSVARRQNDGITGQGGNSSTSLNLPPPDLNPDGTGGPAQLLPFPEQQPVRLYDRGLPTEHYGFYTYFKRTLYVKSVTVPDNPDASPIPVDSDGGSTEEQANFLVTWTQVRLLVQIWTRTGNSTALLLGGANGTLLQPGATGPSSSANSTRPGTMPYPVTITMDTHGGEPGQKLVWEWPIDARQHIVTSEPKLLSNNVGFAGTIINPRATGDPALGGFDGGSGGCKCEWVNFVARSPAAPGFP